MEPRVKLYVPREEAFPIPLKYIDVTRTRHTSLDVMLEKNIDDYWNGEDQLLRTSTLIWDRPDRGEEQDNLREESDGSSSTPRQDSLWYDGEAKIDFWSVSRDFIYRHHVEPRVKLYVPTEESFPIPLKYIDVTRSTDTTLDVRLEKSIDDCWNVDGDRELSDTWTGFTRFTILSKKPQDGYTWFGERLTRKQTTSRPDNFWPEMWKHMSDEKPNGRSSSHHHEDHIAGKCMNSLSHYNMVRNFIPMPQAIKNTRCKGSSGKNGKTLRKHRMEFDESQNKTEVIAKARSEGRKVHFASLMYLCHLKNSELEPQFQKYQGRILLRGNIVKDDSGSYAIFTEQGSSTSQMTAAKVMDIISSLPGCAEQAADAVSAYTQVKMEDAPSLLKIPKSECPDILRLPKHKWPKSWSSMEDPVVPLERNLYGHFLVGRVWERHLRKSY